MTSREFLLSLGKLKDSIDSNRTILEVLKAQTANIPENEANLNPLTKRLFTKKKELEATIPKQEALYIQTEKKILDVISTLKSSKYRQVLELHYVYFYSWRNIAIILGYSPDLASMMQTMNRRALKQIKIYE